MVAAAAGAVGGVAMNAVARRALAALHRGCGALFGCALFVILFTGCWSLAGDSFTLWWNGVTMSGEQRPLAQLLDDAKAYGEDGAAPYVMLPSARYPVIRFCRAPDDCALALSAVSGRPISLTAPTTLLVTLHKNLFLGFPGRVFLSLFGIAFTVLLISGIALHGRRLRQLLQLRRRQGLRVLLFDLHNLLGLWCYPWLVMFALTGALSGLGALGTVLLADRVSPGAPQRVMAQLMGGAQPAPPLSDAGRTLAQTMVALRHQTPEFTPQILQRAPDGALLVVGGVTRGIPSSALFEQFRFGSSEQPALMRRSAARQGPWTRAFIAVQPLHYGQYAWLPQAEAAVSAMHFLTGFGAATLALSGLVLWCLRQPQHRAARFITGVCCGLTVAGSLLLAARPLASFPAAWLFWGMWGTVALLAWRVWLGWILFGSGMVGGTALLVAALGHILSVGPGLYWLDSALLLVSAALFAAGSLLWQSRGAWPH
ncbi:TPA: PepSY domain-containing protein [Klebsiella pneumoniae]|nr:PepSY domain-containing protein [Klebsiella pneumoniae]HBR1346193.1 PepSY domain-containing protein [Klebsiella pneumoniae]HBR1680536.1 PepSY domain-containing protein [Klebsiella pneumoniae]HBR2144756.1 PepSY domain-containing protein [Klebsiella pneumoniae]